MILIITMIPYKVIGFNNYVCLHFKVRKWLFSLLGLSNPKDEATESRPKYDFADEVLAWRIKLRKEK